MRIDSVSCKPSWPATPQPEWPPDRRRTAGMGSGHRLRCTSLPQGRWPYPPSMRSSASVHHGNSEHSSSPSGELGWPPHVPHRPSLAIRHYCLEWWRNFNLLAQSQEKPGAPQPLRRGRIRCRIVISWRSGSRDDRPQITRIKARDQAADYFLPRSVGDIGITSARLQNRLD